MGYIAPVILSLPIVILPFLGNRSISWGIVILILGYFWIGVALGQGIGKKQE